METILLEAKKRSELGKKVKTLRKSGFIPAVIYGYKTNNTPLTITKKDFREAFDKAGTSAIVDLKIDKDPIQKVLIHEPQIDPVSGEPIHIDFYKVRMDQKIKTEIPLVFIGESAAVKELEGSLVTNKDSVEIECLPNDLISEIKVDISPLKTFEDSIHIKDIEIPETISILNDPEETVALVEEPRSEEELAELEEAVSEDIEEVKVEGEEEKEGEAIPEGEEAPKDGKAPIGEKVPSGGEAPPVQEKVPPAANPKGNQTNNQ
jgi:large subunit ribosomal protein L25